jgi:hypothetical protein
MKSESSTDIIIIYDGPCEAQQQQQQQRQRHGWSSAQGKKK